ncbi:MAG TPA: carbohydrate kinase family protein [Telluria sp.]|nr:carbohydrate kinase family protein [Telluria sp.]
MTFARTGRATCIGAANIDRKLASTGPLRMGTSNPARQYESFGGVARNIAENLARLGAQVSLVTAVGDDTAGRAILGHAAACGIDVGKAIKFDGAASGTYTAVLDERGDMVVALADMALYDMLTPERVRPGLEPGALTIADLNLPSATVAALLREAAPLVVVAVSEPKMERLPADLSGLRLLILNLGELQARLGRTIEGEAQLLAACREVQAQGALDVIVTRGSAGVSYTTGGGVAHMDAEHVEVVDVTGAGDAFAAAVCWSLMTEGDDLGVACKRGLHLAALTVACPTTVIPAKAGTHAESIAHIQYGFPLSRE